ncbi:biotin transporter BioY [Humidisolicoccus flavus]|uniref:biotin transporter BioY n=1 Tax=Humidisolicoccus flavus TaxID=3111414 RepID=UPI0032525CFB
MTSLALGGTTLADRVLPVRGPAVRSQAAYAAGNVALIAGGALFTALMAQVFIPLYPVPITGQTLAVLVVGSALGAWRGAASLTLYAIIGLLGAPVFQSGASGIAAFMSPSGGFIIGFIFAAFITGWLAQRRWDRNFKWATLAYFAGSAVPFIIGLPWLAATLGLDASQTLMVGLVPFIPGGIIKALIAAALIPLLWKTVRDFDARRDAKE